MTTSPTTITRRDFAAGLALTPLALAAVPHRVAARQATPAATRGVFRYAFGDYDICLFDTGGAALPASLGAANASPEEQKTVTEASGPFIMDNAVALVDTGSGVVLLDGGDSSMLGAKLEKEGYTAADIDVITFSHLHVDHVSGALDLQDKPLFPNARYVVSKAEHDYWMGEDERPVSEHAEPYMSWFRSSARGYIEAMGSQLELVEWDEEFLPGVRMISAIGHSGGHAGVEIVSGEETLLHVGDLICNPVLHLEYPEWFIAAAVWPEEDLASRRRLMDRAADEHLLVQTVHFPFPGAGYVERDGDAWAWLPLA